MSPRQLITTADDFGASLEANAAVAQACREGILRYASLMVDAPAAADAAAQARACPGLGVGVHLVLCQGNPGPWGLRLLADAPGRRRVESLLTAQIERFLAWGLTPTHLDTHHNVHVHPLVWPAMVRLARRYRIGRIRWPAASELGPSLAFAWAHWRAAAAGSPVHCQSDVPLLPQALLAGVYGALGLALKGRAQGLCVARAFGMLHSGLMTEDYVIWLLRRLPEGLTEIYFHPERNPALLAGKVPTPTHRSLTELQTLLSPRVRQALREENIQLLSAG